MNEYLLHVTKNMIFLDFTYQEILIKCNAFSFYYINENEMKGYMNS